MGPTGNLPIGIPSTEVPDRAFRKGRPIAIWPIWLIAVPAMLAIWSGWVGIGAMTGFGIVHPLPGIIDGFTINTAITLPIGMEAYAGLALRVWFAGNVPTRARRFARWSAITALAIGMSGQVAYHLMTAAGWKAAPWPITTAVSCIPVAVLGLAVTLIHLVRTAEQPEPDITEAVSYEPGELSGLPDAPVSPAPAPVRTPEEWMDLFAAAYARTGTRVKAAAALGTTERQIRRYEEQTGRKVGRRS